MAGFITFLVVFVALVLIGLVLMQRTKAGGGLGAVAGGQSEAMFGANAGNVLGKATAWLIAVFFALTLLLTIVGPGGGVESQFGAEDSEAIVAPAAEEAPAAPAETPAPSPAETE